MKTFPLAFDGNVGNLYLPHNYQTHSVVYTRAHDNDTSLSWYENLSLGERHRLRDYLGFDVEANMPMQDVLGLSKGNRMNLPCTIDNNWRWRFQWEQLPTTLAEQLRHLNVLYSRYTRGY